MAPSAGAESERWCIVLVVVQHDGSLVLVVEPTRQAVPCPKCGEPSRRQHGRYERNPLDLPWRGYTVRLRVHSRRWFCDAPTCPRKIFAERVDSALAGCAAAPWHTELLTRFALQDLLEEEESTARANAATQKRLRQASFPYAATIEQSDFRLRPELKRQVVLRYLDTTFVEQHVPSR